VLILAIIVKALALAYLSTYRKMQSDLKIVFAIVYKEILQLTMLEELLSMIKHDFTAKVFPKLKIDGDVIHTLPSNYDQRFQDIMVIWEQKRNEEAALAKSGTKVGEGFKMRASSDNKNKSKKALKKEAKKLKMIEEGGGG